MNPQLVQEAMKEVTEPYLLINAISRRVRQLNSGSRPMVQTGARMGLADVALKEIIEKKLLVVGAPLQDTEKESL